MATDTKLDSLVINYLTQSQYNTAKTNGKLNANQIYMTPASNTSYTLPTATSSTLGGVKIGDNITVDSGKISLTKANINYALGNTDTDNANFSLWEYDNIIGGNNNNVGTRKAGSFSGKNQCCIVVGNNNNMQPVDSKFTTGVATWFTNGIACGCYIKSFNDTSNHDQMDNNFMIGNGSSSATSNAFRITSTGKAYGGTYSSSGADYAEMFEWQDGNPDGEDRRGMFVTLDGKYIRLANSKDTYILGIVSGNPTVLGDTAEDQWAGMYERDIFGALKHDSTTENGLVLNPNYDNDKQYIARGQRKEWDAVGLMGKLVVIDDGTCEINGFCAANDNGIGTKAKTGYRVMERLDENHIRVLVK